jgi:hypothetical protein
MLDMEIRKLPPYASDERFEEIGIKKLCFNVDSRFRRDYRISSTNYTYHFPTEVKNAVAVNISSIEFPNTYHIISEFNHTNQFKILYLGDLLTVTVSDGNYTADELFDGILKSLADTGKGDWDVSVNTITGRVSIVETNGIPFNMYFDMSNNFSKRSCDFGLGFILGFSKKEYLGASRYTGESYIHLYGDPYILLKINNYDVIWTRTREKELYGSMAKVILNSPKVQYVFDNANFITKRHVFYQPTNIGSLNIQLTNPYGDLIDFDGANWSFTFEIEVVENSHLYEQYRLHRLS